MLMSPTNAISLTGASCTPTCASTLRTCQGTSSTKAKTCCFCPVCGAHICTVLSQPPKNTVELSCHGMISVTTDKSADSAPFPRRCKAPVQSSQSSSSAPTDPSTSPAKTEPASRRRQQHAEGEGEASTNLIVPGGRDEEVIGCVGESDRCYPIGLHLRHLEVTVRVVWVLWLSTHGRTLPLLYRIQMQDDVASTPPTRTKLREIHVAAQFRAKA